MEINQIIEDLYKLDEKAPANVRLTGLYAVNLIRKLQRENEQLQQELHNVKLEVSPL